ncbi:MAG: hypothetical protein ACOYNS_18460, partial [Bacteroidota bacterium]
RVVDGIGGGGKYAKISDAVTAALAGDTIDVLNGTYNETATISISKRVVLKGAGYTTGGTILTTSVTIDPAADNAKVFGFRFNGAAVLIEAGAENILIADNYFSGLSGSVTINSSAGDTIRNNIFKVPLNGVGIATQYNITLSNITINNNIFDGEGSTSNSNGLYLQAQLANSSNIRIYNNFFGDLTRAFNNDWSAFGSWIITGNMFVRLSAVSVSAVPAMLYSGNWTYNMPVSYTDLTNGSANGTGNPGFKRFDQTKGFVYAESLATDSDLRLADASTPFPSSPVDGSYQPISPMFSSYVDVQQQPGSGNTNRPDIGIFGGPYPFKSPFVASTIPIVSSVTVKSKKTGASSVGPKDIIQVNVTGSFGGGQQEQKTDH